MYGTQARDADHMASSRSVDLCSSRSLQELMPQKKGARHGGDFHFTEAEAQAMAGATVDDCGAVSGPSTQRSARGPVSARLAGHRANLGPVARDGPEGVTDAAAAAARMTSMTIHDAAEQAVELHAG